MLKDNEGRELKEMSTIKLHWIQMTSIIHPFVPQQETFEIILKLKLGPVSLTVSLEAAKTE